MLWRMVNTLWKNIWCTSSSNAEPQWGSNDSGKVYPWRMVSGTIKGNWSKWDLHSSDTVVEKRRSIWHFPIYKMDMDNAQANVPLNIAFVTPSSFWPNSKSMSKSGLIPTLGALTEKYCSFKVCILLNSSEDNNPAIKQGQSQSIQTTTQYHGKRSMLTWVQTTAIRRKTQRRSQEFLPLISSFKNIDPKWGSKCSGTAESLSGRTEYLLGLVHKPLRVLSGTQKCFPATKDVLLDISAYLIMTYQSATRLKGNMPEYQGNVRAEILVMFLGEVENMLSKCKRQFPFAIHTHISLSNTTFRKNCVFHDVSSMSGRNEACRGHASLPSLTEGVVHRTRTFGAFWILCQRKVQKLWILTPLYRVIIDLTSI